MSNRKMRLEAERSLAFAEACERGAETPAEMFIVLQLEKRAMAKLRTAGHFVLAALDVEPLPAHTHEGRVVRQPSRRLVLSNLACPPVGR